MADKWKTDGLNSFKIHGANAVSKGVRCVKRVWAVAWGGWGW